MIHHLVEWTKHVDAAKRAEQMDFARRLTARAASMFPKANFQLLNDVNDTSKAYWHDTFESLAAWESAWAALGQDEEFTAIWNEGMEKGFISSVNKHKFLRSVSS